MAQYLHSVWPRLNHLPNSKGVPRLFEGAELMRKILVGSSVLALAVLFMATGPNAAAAQFTFTQPSNGFGPFGTVTVTQTVTPATASDPGTVEIVFTAPAGEVFASTGAADSRFMFDITGGPTLTSETNFTPSGPGCTTIPTFCQGNLTPGSL